MMRILRPKIKPAAAQKPLPSQTSVEDRKLSRNLNENKQVLQEIFDHCDDVIYREILLGKKQAVKGLLVFISGGVNLAILQQDIIAPLLGADVPMCGISSGWLQEQVVSAAIIEAKKTWQEVGDDVAAGLVAMLVDGQDTALLISAMGKNSRAIEQPVAETIVKGPHDAFNEDLETNTVLLRKRLHTSRLAVEKYQVGKYSRTRFNLVYLKGLAKEELLEEARSRVTRVKVDGIISSGQMEEFIQDSPYSFFSMVEETERPDRLSGQLLEGKIGVLFDNTPFALMFPITLFNQLHTSEDYFSRYWYASAVRLLRGVSLLLALLTPSLYIAIITFHQELLPTDLLISIIVSREGVPFPTLLEALLMEISFEILREAGVRLPRPFGQTISVVGALVVGQAAVNAGLVSPAMVVVVALTAIANYTIPSISLANTVRLLRFSFMLLAGVLGMFGVVAGFSFLLFHLCSLRSFGIPYLSPLAPLTFSDLKDTFIRVPAWAMRYRPKLFSKEPQRQAAHQKPGPPPVPAKKNQQDEGGG